MVHRWSPQENDVKFDVTKDLSSAARYFFEDNGFAVFGDVLSNSEIDTILDEIDRVAVSLPRDHPDMELELGVDGAIYGSGRIYRIHLHSDYIRTLSEKDRSLRAIAKLCPGSEQLMKWYKFGVVYQNKMLSPSSRFKGLRWHDDSEAPSYGYGRVLAVGIYLDASTQENGAVRVVPGSHRYHRHMQMPLDIDLHPREVAVTARRGDVVAHISGLWHCSPEGWVEGQEGRRRTLYFAFSERDEAEQQRLVKERADNFSEKDAFIS